MTFDLTNQSLQQILEQSGVYVPDQVGSLIDGAAAIVLSDAERLPVCYPANHTANGSWWLLARN